jgi:hypothetical protein
MPSTFLGRSSKKMARELHYDIVRHLIDLARKISIVEKFSEVHTMNHSLIKKSDIES